MKNLSSFEAFRLNKVQMGAVKGGSRKCHVTYNDALGGTFDVTLKIYHYEIYYFHILSRSIDNNVRFFFSKYKLWP